MASLVNMETSKVNDYEYTVFTAIKGMFRKNPYMPREVRDYKEGQQEIDWEKADLCPVAMAEAMVYHHIDDEEKKLRKWAERPLKKRKKGLMALYPVNQLNRMKSCAERLTRE